ncbi:MAG TPA: diacylglycerol kinase family protein [Anaerolineae bacterium]|jgi:diacylglycerol kinase
MPDSVDQFTEIPFDNENPSSRLPPDGSFRRATTLIASFGYAFTGIAYAFRTQRNFKIHAVMTALVIAAGFIFQVTIQEWEALAVVIGLVFQTELTNTAVEAIVDRISPDYHELAKVAKDCSAAAVLVTAIASTIVGLAIFGHHIMAIAQGLGLWPG